MNKPRFTICIAEDAALLRKLICARLQREMHAKVEFMEVNSLYGIFAPREIRQVHLFVVNADLFGKGLDTELLRSYFPKAGIVLYESRSTHDRLLPGVDGYVSISSGPEQLVTVVRKFLTAGN